MTKVYKKFDGKRYLLGFTKHTKREADKTADYQRSIGRLARVVENNSGHLGDRTLKWDVWVYGYYKTQRGKR